MCQFVSIRGIRDLCGIGVLDKIIRNASYPHDHNNGGVAWAEMLVTILFDVTMFHQSHSKL